jgi:hypothetical protein
MLNDSALKTTRGNKMKNIIRTAALAVVIGSAHASTISWNAAAIADDSAVSTAGTLIEAYNFGQLSEADSPAINGVTFTAAPDLGTQQSIGKLSTLWDWSRGDYTRYKSYTNGVLSANMSLMLGSTWADDASATGGFDETTMTLSGLTIGQDYSVQLFLSNDNNNEAIGIVDGLSSIIDASEGPKVFTGTFTADATTQDFDVRFTKYAGAITESNMSGYQLRAIPEPASISLIGIMGGGLLWMRRRAIK